MSLLSGLHIYKYHVNGDVLNLIKILYFKNVTHKIKLCTIIIHIIYTQITIFSYSEFYLHFYVNHVITLFQHGDHSCKIKLANNFNYLKMHLFNLGMC